MKEKKESIIKALVEAGYEINTIGVSIVSDKEAIEATKKLSCYDLSIVFGYNMLDELVARISKPNYSVKLYYGISPKMLMNYICQIEKCYSR